MVSNDEVDGLKADFQFEPYGMISTSRFVLKPTAFFPSFINAEKLTATFYVISGHAIRWGGEDYCTTDSPVEISFTPDSPIRTAAEVKTAFIEWGERLKRKSEVRPVVTIKAG